MNAQKERKSLIDDDSPPVDSAGKLIAGQLSAFICGALYLKFQAFLLLLTVMVEDDDGRCMLLAIVIIIYCYNIQVAS